MLSGRWDPVTQLLVAITVQLPTSWLGAEHVAIGGVDADVPVIVERHVIDGLSLLLFQFDTGCHRTRIGREGCSLGLVLADHRRRLRCRSLDLLILIRRELKIGGHPDASDDQHKQEDAAKQAAKIAKRKRRKKKK